MRTSPPITNLHSDKLDWLPLIILGALMAITSLSVDIYLPQMPQMHKELHGNIELTITGFLIGFSVAQIFWGPVSDKFGRRLPMALGLVLFIIGSIGCALSENIIQIVFWRVLQAFGACTGPMLARAMIRDRFQGAKAAEILSSLMTVMAVAPILGPLIGGQLRWQYIFWLLTSIGALMLFAIWKLPETLPSDKRMHVSLTSAFSNYRILFNNQQFVRYTLCVTFYYVGAYAFIAGSPFVYITYFGINPSRYGLLFGVNIIGLVLVSQVNRYLVRHYSLNNLLRVATMVATISGVALVLLVKLNVGGIYGVLLPVFFFFSMNGVIAAAATASAMDGVPHMAGSASALLGSLQYGSGILSTILLTLFANGTPQTMAWIIAVFCAASALTIFLNKSQNNNELLT